VQSWTTNIFFGFCFIPAHAHTNINYSNMQGATIKIFFGCLISTLKWISLYTTWCTCSERLRRGNTDEEQQEDYGATWCNADGGKGSEKFDFVLLACDNV